MIDKHPVLTQHAEPEALIDHERFTQAWPSCLEPCRSVVKVQEPSLSGEPECLLPYRQDSKQYSICQVFSSKRSRKERRFLLWLKHRGIRAEVNMKENDSGDFCILYIEPADDRAVVLQTVAAQKKPVVIMLAEQARVFQHPDDFTVLKHAKRQLDLPIVFVIPRGERLTQMAGRNGFPVYASVDALADALTVGQLTRQRALSRSPEIRTTGPLVNGSHAGPISSHPVRPQDSIKKTVPLAYAEQERPVRRTEPLASSSAQGTLTPPQPLPPLASPLPPPQPELSPRVPYVQPLHVSQEHLRLAQPVGREGYAGPVQVPQTRPQEIGSMPPLQPQPAPARKRRRSMLGMIVMLCVLGLLALGGIGTGVLLVLTHNGPAAPVASSIIGHVSFLSSEQLSENSNQGIADEVQVSLTSLANPVSGKSYYGWLLGDKNQVAIKPILLGMLQVHNGTASLLYKGDANHTNLLAITSRFLVTEEDATMTPIAPSPDQTTWRYSGEFLQAPASQPAPVPWNSSAEQQYSFLDHLRHLLAADPLLDTLELPGGLSIWLYTNTSKIFEWTGSTREHWEETKEISFIRRQMIRSLAYLDGLSYVQQDLPSGTPLNMNERLARIGMLRISGPNQDPPAYIDHISFHLSGLMQAGGAPAELRTKIAAIIRALNNVDFWLQQVRRDAQQIMKMTDAELQQPQTLSLLDDMIANANYAYVGMNDPAGGAKLEGATWIHDQIQSLATIGVTPYSSTSHTPPQMVPDTKKMAGRREDTL